MLAIFAIHIDKHGKCKFVLASESGKFNEEGTGGHFPASYHNDMGVGLLLAYFIFKVFQNLLAEWASVPRFPHFFGIQTSPSLASGRRHKTLKLWSNMLENN